MSFKIDGKTWTPQTTNEHALNWITKLNAILEENDIRDESGNIIKLSQNFANALYLLMLSGSDRLKDNDEKLQSAINSFNVDLCDDEQIENLLPIASIQRNEGSYSTIKLTCTAGDAVCTIPKGTKAPFGEYNFITDYEAVIQPNETQNISATCDKVGAVAVLQGEITSFEVQIPNLASVVNNVSSDVGSDAESVDSLRKRIQQGQIIPYSLDGVKYAIEELKGIKHARVYFNFSTTNTTTLEGGIVLQPRTAYIVINGESNEIASTYAKYMSAPTQNAPNASTTGTPTTVNLMITCGSESVTLPIGTSFVYDNVTFEIDEETTLTATETATVGFTATEVGAVTIPSGTIHRFTQEIDGLTYITNAQSVEGLPKTAYSQDYITASGQSIPIYYDKADSQQVFVRVVLEKGENNDTEQIRNQIKRDLIASSANWVIGESITSLITSAPFNNCVYAKIAYTQVSTDGTSWSNRVTTSANVIPHVSDSTIIIESVQ